MQNLDHNIGFLFKSQFFRRKLSKIAQNCDHNIDPRFGDIFHLEKNLKLDQTRTDF
jgi:Zn/Cd-binding protein ZinT